MTNAIILHGKPRRETYFDHTSPSSSNSIWIPWLQQELLLLGIPTQTPEMINAWQPDYQIWSKEFERYELTSSTLLIGHSMGAGFLVQWLSEHPQTNVGNVFLIAPSLGDRFTPNTKLETPTVGGFFEFDLDPNLTQRTNNITIFHSDDDNERVASSVEYIRNTLPTIEYQEFHKYGHFRGKRDMASDEFPELLAAIKSKQS